MFQASNMTYMRRREAEKKATRRAMQKAELRRQKMEELQLLEAAQGNQEEEEEEEGETQSEFYDVCNNIQKTESGDTKKKRKHHKVITASD